MVLFRCIPVVSNEYVRFKTYLLSFRRENLVVSTELQISNDGDPTDSFDPDAEKELVCTYQNVTLVDQKSKQQAGPYCGDEMPPMFLSDSHKIEIEALGGVIPSGMFYKA